MIVKIVRNETPTNHERSELVPCADVTKTVIRAGSTAARAGSSPGVIVSLGGVGNDGVGSREIRLPDDADVVYVMNNEGVTIDRIIYNPSGNQSTLRNTR